VNRTLGLVIAPAHTGSLRRTFFTKYGLRHVRATLAGLVASLLAIGAVGCANTPALSPEGSRVALSRQSPPSSCRELGPVVGEGGGSGIVGGRWIANDKLVGYATSDLRNKASALGSNYVQVDSPQLGSSLGTTSTVTISGTAYRCEGPTGT
jgi:hypothetical protein